MDDPQKLRILPRTYFGPVSEEVVDWRNKPDVDPDDEQLAVTPPDVIRLLGFDPLKVQDG